jgi:hypothetical protein
MIGTWTPIRRYGADTRFLLFSRANRLCYGYASRVASQLDWNQRWGMCAVLGCPEAMRARLFVERDMR